MSHRSGAREVRPGTALPVKLALRLSSRFNIAANPLAGVADCSGASPGAFTAVRSFFGGTRLKSPSGVGRGRATSMLKVRDSPGSKAGTCKRAKGAHEPNAPNGADSSRIGVGSDRVEPTFRTVT